MTILDRRTIRTAVDAESSPSFLSLLFPAVVVLADFLSGGVETSKSPLVVVSHRIKKDRLRHKSSISNALMSSFIIVAWLLLLLLLLPLSSLIEVVPSTSFAWIGSAFGVGRWLDS